MIPEIATRTRQKESLENVDIDELGLNKNIHFQKDKLKLLFF